jgi:quinol-cytochrome oxidoreductase complex cytochrome b subunit
MRVFYAGAYRRPRQFNWVIGVVLLVLTLLMSFTGYLLPWDQLSYWAITVGTNIAGYLPLLGNQARLLLLGGNEVGSATLLRFYVLHIYVIPAAMVLVIAIHIWRVRKDNFAVVDRHEDEIPEVTEGSKEEADVEA